MVRSGKRSFAVGTLERLDPRVFPHVPGKLVGSRKLPVAAFPAALVGLFTSVGSLVGLEVGALGVDFVAAGVGASVDPLVALRRLGIVVDCVY